MTRSKRRMWRTVLVLVPLAWLWAWLAGEWEGFVKQGWEVSTGNPPSQCCGGGGGGGFGGDGPTNYPNDARRK